MGLTSPLHSVKGYSSSKPPLTIFVICLVLCASATLAMGFFIQYAETVLNPEVNSKWVTFLNHLVDMDFCVSEGNEQMDGLGVMQFIDGGAINSTDVSTTVSVSLRLVSNLKRLTLTKLAAYGNIPVGDWAVLREGDHPLKSLKIAFVIPPDLTETSSQNSCLILAVPSAFLPLSTRSSVCVPSFVNKTISRVGTISVIKPNGTDPICKSGAFLKLNYDRMTDQDFYLSKVEKRNVYLRLLHISYFLLIVAAALTIFSFLKRQTSSVVTLDKMPLTL